MRYSVIIPVYNAETTICRCLDSVLNQSPLDTELIIVNDGSTDSSGMICKEYAHRYECIRYFEKDNGGVSSARNMGLDNAQGEYILFLDSDDYIAENYFTVITKALEEYHPQLLNFGIQNVGADNRSWSLGDFYLDTPLQIAKKINYAVRKCLFFNLLSKVFERKLIETHRVRFNENVCIGEDLAFGFTYATHVNTMASIPDVLYYLVEENEQSLSRKKRDYLADQLLLVSNDMYEAVQKSGLYAQIIKVHMDTVSWLHYRNAYSASKELLKFCLSDHERKEKIKTICCMYTLPHMNPRSFSVRLIAFPVIYRMSTLMDFVICLYDRYESIPS